MLQCCRVSANIGCTSEFIPPIWPKHMNQYHHQMFTSTMLQSVIKVKRIWLRLCHLANTSETSSMCVKKRWINLTRSRTAWDLHEHICEVTKLLQWRVSDVDGCLLPASVGMWTVGYYSGNSNTVCVSTLGPTNMQYAPRWMALLKICICTVTLQCRKIHQQQT